MPDRLNDLYQQLAAKLESLDKRVRAMDGKDGRPPLGEPFLSEWKEALELAGRQRAMVAEIRRRDQELSSLSAFLQTHSEHEKASLARELHDQLGGILTPAKMDLAWLQQRLGDDAQYAHRLARLSALIDQGIDLKRRIIENLRPSLLDHLGFAAAVQWFVDEACGAANIKCRVTVSRLERLSADFEIALYRVVQESVMNAIRHSKASNVELIVERTAEGLRVAVCDDGVGIEDLESARRQAHGLVGMTQRMRAISGTLDISSRKGQGTRVEVFLPIAA